MSKSVLLVVSLFFLLVAFRPLPVQASHSWGNYHWARTSNPFTLKLGDNVSGAWDPVLVTSSSDWSLSSVLDTTIVSGNTAARRCRPTSGRVEVCNYRYGNNGWLGLAQIWISGNHITQGVTKVNDTYFNTSTYNTPAWRNLVMCQEIGHNLGLDHQDENFSNPNLGTCMDYTSSPSANQHPNAHDYEQLESIYAHMDSLTTLSQSLRNSAPNREDFENPIDWGTLRRKIGRLAIYERVLSANQKLFTFVIWAD